MRTIVDFTPRYGWNLREGSRQGPKIAIARFLAHPAFAFRVDEGWANGWIEFADVDVQVGRQIGTKASVPVFDSVMLRIGGAQ